MSILDYVVIKKSKKIDGNMSYTYGEKNEVTKNRKRFWKKNRFDYQRTYLLRTDFNNLDNVMIKNKIPNEFMVIPDTDSVITNSKEIVLALLTADCLQIVLFDPVNRVLALIHAGFRWQDAGIIDKTLNTMIENYNSNPSDILVYLGDCILEKYYRWDENILKHVRKDSWISKTIIKDTDNEKPYKIDLRNAALLNLMDLGVLEENIVDSKIDSYSNLDYFSHVRALNSGEKEGRHVTVVKIK